MDARNVLGAIIGITLLTTFGATTPIIQQEAKAGIFDFGHLRQAPIAMSGNNIYIAWQSNNTVNGNEDIMFRKSTDGGQTFGDKINLSNTTNADSSRVQIDSNDSRVVVTWWETNQTTDTPVMRFSTDNGQTFGPVVRLATNGTISSSGGGGT